MVDKFVELVKDFMASPNVNKKMKIEELYKSILDNKQIEASQKESAKTVYSYVEWIISVA